MIFCNTFVLSPRKARGVIVRTAVGRMKEFLAQLNGSFSELKDFLLFLDHRFSNRALRDGKEFKTTNQCHTGSLSKLKKAN